MNKFNLKHFIKDIEAKIPYLENLDFYKKMSEISDITQFSEMMDLQNDKKTGIEQGIIYMSSKEKLEDFEIKFLDKYHKYIISNIEKDVRVYHTNKYCSYLVSSLWDRLYSKEEIDTSTEEKSNIIKFINGKTLNQINELLVEKHEQLLENIRNNEEIDKNDKDFLEEFYLSIVYDRTVYKEYDGDKDVMYDIVDYFDKYPVNDINSPRNKQLHLLSILSKRMIEIPKNCAIQFQNENIYNEDGKETFGSFGRFENSGIYCIEINALDTYNLQTEQDFLEKIFTLFHEFGHFIQEIRIEDYVDEIKELILMEKSILKHNRDFYNKYHDSFFVEKDADNYAIIEIISEYGEKYPELVYKIVSSEQNRKRIADDEFYSLELEEYNNIIKNEENKIK